MQRISKETGAHIHIPKSEGVLHPEADEDDSMTIDVVIEGDAVSAESARQAIEAIVNERTSTVTMRLHEIPPEFFPFIAGHHNSGISALESGRQIRISIPHYYTWSREPPLHSSSREAPKFPPDPNNQIIISGDRLAAQEVRSEIEQQVARLHDEIGLSQVGINRGRHQFIAGTKGDLLHNLLQETGCTVVLPPPSNDTEMLFVTGPKDRLKSGVEKIVDLAMVMQMSNVDVARQHPSSTQASQAYARSLTRYFQQRGIISQLEKQNEAFIVLPVTLGGPMNWEVYSKKAMNSVKARTNIVDLIKAYPPERIRYVPVDPFFYQHLEQRSAPLIHEEFGVYLLLPDPDHEASEVVLIYEEPSGGNEAVYQPTNQVPTKNDIIGFQKSLDQAQEHISDLMKHQDDLGAASITVPRK